MHLGAPILFAVARDDLHANRFSGDSRDSHRNRVADDAIPRSCPKKFFMPLGGRIRRESTLVSSASARRARHHGDRVVCASRMQEIRNLQGFFASRENRRPIGGRRESVRRA
jgi:hypothetical protein